MPDTSLFSFLVPAGITVAGWFIVARQAEEREFRKEVSERVVSLKAVTDDVLGTAASYWITSSVKAAPVEAVRLKADLKRLSRHTNILTSAGLEFDPAQLLTAVRQIATGGEFEKIRRRHSAGDSERVGELAGAIEDLLIAVDHAFYERFKPMRRSPRIWNWLPIGGAIFLTRG